MVIGKRTNRDLGKSLSTQQVVRIWIALVVRLLGADSGNRFNSSVSKGDTIDNRCWNLEQEQIGGRTQWVR